MTQPAVDGRTFGDSRDFNPAAPALKLVAAVSVMVAVPASAAVGTTWCVLAKSAQDWEESVEESVARLAFP